MCSLCGKTFFNPDVLRCHKKPTLISIKEGELLRQVGGRGRFKIHILHVSSLFNFLYLIVNIITAQSSCLIVNIIIHLFYVHPSLNVYLFTLLNLLHTIHHRVTCILCHFQDTLRAGNYTLQNDVSGLVFLLHVLLFFVGCVS